MSMKPDSSLGNCDFKAYKQLAPLLKNSHSKAFLKVFVLQNFAKSSEKHIQSFLKEFQSESFSREF